MLHPETAEPACRWLEKTHGQPCTRTVPLGVGATRDFVAEVARLAGIEHKPGATEGELRLPWRSRSVDGACLTGKRVFIFGDATHAIAAARIAADEIGFEVCGLECCNREFARDLREAAKRHGVEPPITDDCLEVEAAIAAAGPELILGSQMERHIAKRFGIPCATISGPFHVQDHPARHSPQMGWEGANVLFDTWIHPLAMGLEEHLLAMVREDREFRDAAGPSHPGAHTPALPHAARGTRAEHGDDHDDISRGRGGGNRHRGADRRPRRDLDRAGGARAAQNSLLHPRQSTPQHRGLRRQPWRGADHHRNSVRSEGSSCTLI